MTRKLPEVDLPMVYNEPFVSGLLIAFEQLETDLQKVADSASSAKINATKVAEFLALLLDQR